MSLELVRESIKVNQIIGQDNTQAIVENDIIVPDVKPDISNVLIVDGDATINSTEVKQDKLLANGTIRYKVLYISEDSEQPVKSINTSVNFSTSIEIPNARSGMKGNIKCEIEHVDYEIMNERKINVKAILSLSGKVSEEITEELTADLRGLSDLQVLKETQAVNCFLGEEKVTYTVRDSLQVPSGKPAIVEILRNDVRVTGRDYKNVDGKIIAKGEVSISTLYIADDEERSIQYMEHEVAFSQVLDIENMTDESMSQVDLRILDYQVEANEDSDGDTRVLNVEVAIGISAEAYEKRNYDVLIDAYSPKAKVNLEKAQLKVEEVVAEGKAQVTLKETMQVGEENPEIAQIFNIMSSPVLLECKVCDDKILIEGCVTNKVIYLAANNEQPVFCMEQEIPFKQTIEIKGIKENMPCNVELAVEHSNYSMMSGRELEIRMVVSASAKISDYMMVQTVLKAVESAIDDKRLAKAPSITIYFAQEEDSLWSIAKRYYTTIADIVRINNISERDQIMKGQQILIPKKYARPRINKKCLE